MTISPLVLIEMVAVGAGLLYVILAAQENRWCWWWGCLNALLSMYLFYVGKLYAETGLFVYYLAAGVYGWWAWQPGGARVGLSVVRWPWPWHGLGIVGSAGLALALGYALERFTLAQNPYLDAQITLFSFWATFLTTRKVLENWWYWMVIDAVSSGLYWSRGFYWYAGLMAIYVVLAYWGWRTWCRARTREKKTPSAGHSGYEIDT